jgi:hypothetical protein
VKTDPSLRHDLPQADDCDAFIEMMAETSVRVPKGQQTTATRDRYNEK